MKKKMKVTFNAPVVLGIVGISFIATLLGYLTGGITSRVIFTTYRSAILSPLTFILVAVFFIGQQILEGIFVRDNISNISHIVGGIIGGLLGYEFNVKRETSTCHTFHSCE